MSMPKSLKPYRKMTHMSVLVAHDEYGDIAKMINLFSEFVARLEGNTLPRFSTDSIDDFFEKHPDYKRILTNDKKINDEFLNKLEGDDNEE